MGYFSHMLLKLGNVFFELGRGVVCFLLVGPVLLSCWWSSVLEFPVSFGCNCELPYSSLTDGSTATPSFICLDLTCIEK